MKAKLLGVVFAGVLGISSSDASTFNYAVNFDLGGNNGIPVTITGNILTSCNNCFLDNTNILAYSFVANDGVSITNAMFNSPNPSPLQATDAGIFFTANGGITSPAVSTFGTASSGTVLQFFYYAIFSPPLNGQIVWLEDCPSCGGGISGARNFILPPSLQIAEFTTAPSVPNFTPLPAALPLFISGLGALGLLGWRSKRKAAALNAKTRSSS